MASGICFLLVLLTATVNLLALETEYECAKLNASDIPEVTFYLKLSNANETTTVSNLGTCPPHYQRETNLECMCGENLHNQRRAIKERLNRTCAYYEEHTHELSSPLQFCERALTQLGKCVTFEPYTDNSNSTVALYNKSDLTTEIEQINTTLLDYFNVLDRTLVGVYLPSQEHRCQCLEHYKRWLCATKLKFYSSSPSSTDNASTSSEGVGLNHQRPCLGVCHNVLQSCPYYLPSRFQPNDKSIIYGGYPAFDCPRPNICKGETCSYGGPSDCFGPPSSHGLTPTASFIWIILQPLLVSCYSFFL